MKSPLTVKLLQAAAARFAKTESKHSEKSMYGVTDGKTVGRDSDAGTIEDYDLKPYLAQARTRLRSSAAVRSSAKAP